MTNNSSPIQVVFQPAGRRIEVEAGSNLLYAAQQAGIDLVAACGGIGICGTCLVRVIGGAVTPPGTSEIDFIDSDRLENGYRLACQCIAEGDVRVEIPPESLPVGQKLQVEGLAAEIKLNPPISVFDLTIPPPTLHDLRSDFTRVTDALAEEGVHGLSIASTLFSSLSEQVRKLDWKMRAVIWSGDKNYLVGILPPGADVLGVAVDIGSTKLAVYLINLQSGVTVAQKGVPNPQISFGEDVVSRIAFANKSFQNRELLQKRLVNTLNETIGELCQSVHLGTDQIVEAVLVGNTAIHHFTCLLPVEQLGAAPYVASLSEPVEMNARDIGLLISPGGRVYLPSIIAGFVGADHTSALLATRFEQKSGIRVLIDIGTNTEISLGMNGQIYSCSTASGPAFEGAHIRDGMRAAPGAIEKVHITPEKNEVVTVGGGAPIGICGTGILQGIAELLRNDVITPQGTLVKDHPGVSRREGGAEFQLVPAHLTGHGRDIVITRKDINEIQLAKAAIRAGIEILLNMAGIHAGSVQEWVIAGAFGTYLNLESAVRIGMFPDVPLERFSQVGNAAGTGAKQMLLSRQERAAARQLVEGIHYVELTVYPEFTKYYVEYMNF